MNAYRDQNNIPTILGTLNSDGKTLIRIKANGLNNRLKISDDTTGSDYGPVNAPRDENDVPAFIAVSSVDGKTPVAVYADSNGNLLIDSV